MSQENVEAVRRTVDRVKAGEIGQHLDALFASRLDFRDELGELDNRDDLRESVSRVSGVLGHAYARAHARAEVSRNSRNPPLRPRPPSTPQRWQLNCSANAGDGFLGN